MNRSRTITVCVACVLGILLGACTTKGPLSVRFSRVVDPRVLAQLPRRSGSVVLLADAEFWTDKQRVSRVPVARREKSFIIGPGATEMAKKMLARMFDRVVEVRTLDRVDFPEDYDFVIRLVHEAFDDRTLLIPPFARHRYRVDLGAEVSRLDGTSLGRAAASGDESFWIASLGEANPLEGDGRVLDRASTTLNAAVQESLQLLMDELAALSAFSEGGP